MSARLRCCAMDSKRSYGIFCNEAMASEDYVFCTIEMRGARDITETTFQLRKKKLKENEGENEV
jgi:hypothetical protein